MPPEVQEVLIALIVAIVSTITSVFLIFSTTFIQKLKAKSAAEIEKIKNEDARNLAKSTLDRAIIMLNLAVERVEQDLVPKLKANAADGKLSLDDQKVVFEEAKRIGLALLGNEGVENLNGVVDDVGEFIKSVIESAVGGMLHDDR